MAHRNPTEERVMPQKRHSPTSRRVTDPAVLRSAPDSSTAQTGGRKRRGMLLVVALLLLAAIGLRIWHDRNAAPSSPAAPQALEQRAREHPTDMEAQLDWGIALQRIG